MLGVSILQFCQHMWIYPNVLDEQSDECVCDGGSPLVQGRGLFTAVKAGEEEDEHEAVGVVD